jgi:hypothetical protein
MSKPVTDTRLPGDPLAALPLKNAAGENVNLWDQSLAGRAVLLWFSGASSSAAAREALSRYLSELESLETLVYEVGPQPTETPLKLAIDGGEAARMIGVAPPGLAVLDSARRLIAVLPDGALEQALILCRDLFARSAPDPVGAQAPVLLVPGLFEPELCRRLIEHWNVSEKRADTVSSVAHGDSYASAAFKNGGMSGSPIRHYCRSSNSTSAGARCRKFAKRSISAWCMAKSCASAATILPMAATFAPTATTPRPIRRTASSP